MTPAQEKYQDYLQSPDWLAKRKFALQFAGHKCQVCYSPERLEVHHRTYENKPNEELADLTVLCHACHELYEVGRQNTPSNSNPHFLEDGIQQAIEVKLDPERVQNPLVGKFLRHLFTLMVYDHISAPFVPADNTEKSRDWHELLAGAIKRVGLRMVIDHAKNNTVADVFKTFDGEILSTQPVSQPGNGQSHA